MVRDFGMWGGRGSAPAPGSVRGRRSGAGAAWPGIRAGGPRPGVAACPHHDHGRRLPTSRRRHGGVPREPAGHTGLGRSGRARGCPRGASGPRRIEAQPGRAPERSRARPLADPRSHSDSEKWAGRSSAFRSSPRWDPLHGATPEGSVRSHGARHAGRSETAELLGLAGDGPVKPHGLAAQARPRWMVSARPAPVFQRRGRCRVTARGAVRWRVCADRRPPFAVEGRQTRHSARAV